MAHRIRQDLRQVELDIDEMLGELIRLKKENKEKDDEIELLNKELNNYRKGKPTEGKSSEGEGKKTQTSRSKSSSSSHHSSSRNRPPELVLESSLSISSTSSSFLRDTDESPIPAILVTKSLTPSSSSRVKKETLVPVFLDEVPVKLSREAISYASSHVKFYPEGDGQAIPSSPTGRESGLRKDPFGTSSVSSLSKMERPGSPRRIAYKVKEGLVQDEFEPIQISSSHETALTEMATPTNVLQFSTGSDATTVFLDFALQKDIWRCDLRFFHDPQHNNESADFGVVNSSTIESFLNKWLYNNVDTCVYLLDRTKPCICVGRTPKPLISQYNARSGTEIAVEVDYEANQIRFYTNTYPIPFAIRNPHKSVHVGITGRWQQRLELISMRRVSRATLRSSDVLPVIDWTTK